ncbi:MAG: metal-dependent transcriptional regulator [Anaerolineales bacterium]
MSESLTPIQREYLADIYRLQYPDYSPSTDPVSTNAIAAQLEVSAPAATKMIRRLEQAGFVRHERYHGVRLTDSGERAALISIRSHRLLEAFLVSVMRFDWEEVHEYAHRLEPAIDARFEARMDELAGYPRRCPHGDPIPSPEGKMPIVNDVAIMDCAIGTTGTMRRIRNHTPEKLRYLGELGLLPGARIRLLGKAPFNGPVRILTMKGEEHVLGVELARDLLIEIGDW